MAKKRNHEIPEALAVIAEDLASLVASHFDEYGSKGGPRKPGARYVDWNEVIGEKMPQNVEEWSWKDVVFWFSQECKKRGVPFIVMYERDLHIVKNIHADLSSIGRNKRGDVKVLIEWAFANMDQILIAEKNFTLGSIRNCINLYLQKEIVGVGEKRSLGFDFFGSVVQEYERSATAGILRRFGIPITAAFFQKEKPDISMEKVAEGTRSRLQKMIGENRQDEVMEVFRRSIVASPYPEWFPLKNWRELFKDMTEALKLDEQGWWKDNDYGGEPLLEYEDFAVQGKEE